MTSLVVDASVPPKWWFNESNVAEALLLLSPRVSLLAPDLLVPELLNIFVQKVRRGATDRETANRAAEELASAPVRLFGTLPLRRQAMELALAYHPSTYDCLYAALALREDCPVVTADRRFYQAMAPAMPRQMLWIEDLAAFLESQPG